MVFVYQNDECKKLDISFAIKKHVNGYKAGYFLIKPDVHNTNSDMLTIQNHECIYRMPQ